MPWRRWCLLLACLLVGGTAGAGDVSRLDVERQGSVFDVTMQARIDAPLDVVYSVLTNYGQLTQLSPSILESTVLEVRPGGLQRVRTVTHLCIWVFCTDLTQIQDMVDSPPDHLAATLLPEGDFRGGYARWLLRPDGDTTYMTFYAHMRPDFWVPPLFGAALVRAALEREARLTVEGFERIYAAQAQ